MAARTMFDPSFRYRELPYYHDSFKTTDEVMF